MMRWGATWTQRRIAFWKAVFSCSNAIGRGALSLSTFADARIRSLTGGGRA